ncbi:MAG: LLM class flavin-dependent oxidoreductase [Acidimicrobiia bacterium]
MTPLATLSIALGRLQQPRAALSFATKIEDLGFDGVWVANERFYRDMWVLLGGIASRTSRVELGTFVADPLTVHPAITAGAAATLAELSGGRVRLGFSSGMTGLQEMGIRHPSPLTATRLGIEAIRRLWMGETVSLDDPVMQMNDLQLAVRSEAPVPIVLASQSPKMLRLAGEVADMAMIATLSLPSTFTTAASWVREGALLAGRSFDIADVVPRIDCSVHVDGDSARRIVQPMVCRLLVSRYPNWWFLTDAGIDVPAEVEVLARNGRLDELIRRADELLTREVVDAMSWAGTPDEVAARIASFHDLGVRRFVLYPHGTDELFANSLDLLANEVLPVLRVPTR